MKNKVLRAKHWQLFLITTGIPFAAMIVSVILQIIWVASNNGRPTGEPLWMIIPSLLIPAIMLFAGLTHLTWIYSIATKLQAYMNPELRKLNVKRFRLFFFIPFFYMLVIMLTVLTVFRSSVGDEENLGVIVPLMLFMILGHSFSAFCAIYVLYFSAKTLNSVEMKMEAHFSDYIGDFMLLWVFPIGVWFIQPRINAIVNGTVDSPKKMIYQQRIDPTDF